MAKYLITIGNGVAMQAAGGAERDILQLVVDAALQNWPPVQAAPSKDLGAG